uniref:Uncharacterized protein n=1 Tax=Romanomermis culicivorax TaxID=13658 RepID=A0A915KGF6_ROMCU
MGELWASHQKQEDGTGSIWQVAADDIPERAQEAMVVEQSVCHLMIVVPIDKIVVTDVSIIAALIVGDSTIIGEDAGENRSEKFLKIGRKIEKNGQNLAKNGPKLDEKQAKNGRKSVKNQVARSKVATGEPDGSPVLYLKN